MKVAVCLSGLLRSVEHSFPTIQKYLIGPYNADVFVHAWRNDDINFVNPKLAFQSISKIDYITQVIKPVKYMFQDVKKTKINGENRKMYKNAATMFHSIYMANQLKKEYEKEHNFKYDIVIRSRMDTFYREFIPAEEIKEVLTGNTVYVTCHMYFTKVLGQSSRQLFKTPKGGHLTVVDNFAFSNSLAMDKYSDVSKNINMLSIKDDIGAETILGSQFELSGLKPKWSKLQYMRLFKWVNKDTLLIRSNYNNIVEKNILR